MSPNSHFVQFYESEETILNAVSGYVASGLEAGDACIVVATKPHCDAIESRLIEASLDAELAGATSRYIAVDAGSLLSKICIGGVPDRKRFEKTIGRLIERARNGGRHVRIFGEMAALLWGDGRHAEAVRLEEFCNSLAETNEFSIFCSYPTGEMHGEELSESFAKVCGQHSKVIPSESYSAIEDETERLRQIALLQQKAASLEAEVAERRRLLILEQMARTEAENANRIKDEFLATVSHELRTPLNAIIGWSNMLSKGTLDAATAGRAIETIKRQALLQAQLIEDILDVSRVVSGKLRLSIGPVDAAAVINAAVDAVQPAADSKNIQVAVTLDPTERHISGDASRLQQVVWNLLSNAIKFTPAGGRVAVRMERVGPDLQIEVSDTGCGVRPDHLASIFDLFSQEDSSRTRQNGGLGLGLAISKQLIELHGGTISARSDGEGFGSVFTVRLPAGTSSKRIAVERGSAFDFHGPRREGFSRDAPRLEGIKVLLVDDDPDSLEMLRIALTGCQIMTETAASAEEACSMLESFSPDIIISDIAMPESDGHALIRRIRASGLTIPAVALTAHTRIEDRVQALASGFNMFVPKPVEIDELLAAVATLVFSER